MAKSRDIPGEKGKPTGTRSAQGPPSFLRQAAASFTGSLVAAGVLVAILARLFTLGDSVGDLRTAVGRIDVATDNLQNVTDDLKEVDDGLRERLDRLTEDIGDLEDALSENSSTVIQVATGMNELADQIRLLREEIRSLPALLEPSTVNFLFPEDDFVPVAGSIASDFGASERLFVRVRPWSGDLAEVYLEVFGTSDDIREGAEVYAIQAGFSEYQTCAPCIEFGEFVAYPSTLGTFLIERRGFIVVRGSPLRTSLERWLVRPETFELIQFLASP